MFETVINQRNGAMKRAVGYCENVGSRDAGGCEDYAKGVFLLNHGHTFYCPRCRELGTVVVEKGNTEGESHLTFKEVRCEFNYNPTNGTFQEIAIVRDESVWGHGRKYTLQSPLIKTEKRALKVAEAILANLQHYNFGDDTLKDGAVPSQRETQLSFDDDPALFTEKLTKLGDEWKRSTMVRTHKPDMMAQEKTE